MAKKILKDKTSLNHKKGAVKASAKDKKRDAISA